MTEIDMARQHGHNMEVEFVDNKDAFNVGYKSFLAGLEAGRPKWHKVSEQKPTEEKDYLVKLTDGTIDVMTIALDGDLEPYLLSSNLDFYKDVEKWCETPKESE